MKRGFTIVELVIVIAIIAIISVILLPQLTKTFESSKENIITTEYEDKFTSQGLKINYLEASKKGDNHESI